MSAQPEPVPTDTQQGTLIPFPATATKSTSRRRRPTGDPSATTPSGDTAHTIVSEWVAWVAQSVGHSPDRDTIGRIAARVLTLITEGYDTQPIKSGLAAWTVEAMDDPRLSPQQLGRYVFTYATSTPQTQQWRARIHAQLAAMRGAPATPATRRRDERDRLNAHALSTYRRPGAPA